MTDTELNQEKLVCKPTKWFFSRVLAMLLMLSVFGVLFLKDGLVGYREQNLHFFIHESFIEAGAAFQEMQRDGVDELEWRAFAETQKCSFPEDAVDILPVSVELPLPWPLVLVDGYADMKSLGGQNGVNELWLQYTRENGWDEDPGEHAMSASKINQQFVAFGVVAVLVLITLFILVRTMRRSISADAEALYTQDGRRVLYSEMVRIDKRQWDTKGIAFIYYRDGEAEAKVKIDGMVYGQFKEENGAPAERLFERVMDHFKGEVLEYIDDADAEDNAEAELAQDVENNGKG